MEQNGWIKLHRCLLDNPIVMKDSAHLAVWIYLLLHATHKDYDVIFNGKRTTLLAGQLLTGCISIGKELDITETKVRRILNEFEADGQIRRTASNKNSLVSIANWNKYQARFEGTFEELEENSQKTADKVADNRHGTDAGIATDLNNEARKSGGQIDGQVADKWRTSDDKQEYKNERMKESLLLRNDGTTPTVAEFCSMYWNQERS